MLGGVRCRCCCCRCCCRRRDPCRRHVLAQDCQRLARDRGRVEVGWPAPAVGRVDGDDGGIPRRVGHGAQGAVVGCRGQDDLALSARAVECCFDGFAEVPEAEGEGQDIDVPVLGCLTGALGAEGNTDGLPAREAETLVSTRGVFSRKDGGGKVSTPVAY